MLCINSHSLLHLCLCGTYWIIPILQMQHKRVGEVQGTQSDNLAPELDPCPVLDPMGVPRSGWVLGRGFCPSTEEAAVTRFGHPAVRSRCLTSPSASLCPAPRMSFLHLAPQGAFSVLGLLKPREAALPGAAVAGAVVPGGDNVALLMVIFPQNLNLATGVSD